MPTRTSSRNLRSNSKVIVETQTTRVTRSKRAASNDESIGDKENLNNANQESPIRKSSRLSRTEKVNQKGADKKESIALEPIVVIDPSETESKAESPQSTHQDSQSARQELQSTHQELQLNPFARAKKSFHRSGSFKIVGRIEEKASFTSFWYDSVMARHGASIYISGNPGTGKTALVDELLAEFESTEIVILKLNCMMLKDPLKAFNHIAAELKLPDCDQPNPYLILSSLEAFFTQPTNQF